MSIRDMAIGAGVTVILTVLGFFGVNAGSNDKHPSAAENHHIALETCAKPETVVVRVLSDANVSFNAKYDVAGLPRVDLTWQAPGEVGKPIAVEKPYEGDGWAEQIDQAFLNCVATKNIDTVTAPHVHLP